MGNLLSCIGSTMERNLDPKVEQNTFEPEKLKTDHLEATNRPELSTRSLTVHNLPPELWLEIFSWFSVRDLCRTIAPVCKSWHLISKYKGLWKHLSFKGSCVTTERLCFLLSHATQLQSLQLLRCEDATTVLRQVALSNRWLKTLNVVDCYRSAKTYQIPKTVLFSIIKNCSSLVELSFEGTHFYNDGILLLTMLPELSTLKAMNAQEVSSEGWHEMIIRSKWNSLRKLSFISCIGVDDNVLETIGGTYPNIQSITLSFSERFTEDGLSKLIKVCKQLVYLRVDFTHINIHQCFTLFPTYTPSLRCLVYGNFYSEEQKLILGDDRQILNDLQNKLPNLEIHNLSF